MTTMTMMMMMMVMKMMKGLLESVDNLLVPGLKASFCA
jgi:hypothetical protein